MLTFNIIGVVPILHFFNYQQEHIHDPQKASLAYLSSHQCRLDAVLRTIDHTEFDPTWNTNDVMQSAIDFWLHNLDSVAHWQRRLNDAGDETILVSRVAHSQALQHELEMLFHR